MNEQEVETRQYCVAVKVWVWASDKDHALDITRYVMRCHLDQDVAGYEIGNIKEDQEV